MNKEESAACGENPRPFSINPDAICSECGTVGAFEFEDVVLCAGCYAAKSSCCPEFGKDDLWQNREESKV